MLVSLAYGIERNMSSVNPLIAVRTIGQRICIEEMLDDVAEKMQLVIFFIDKVIIL